MSSPSPHDMVVRLITHLLQSEDGKKSVEAAVRAALDDDEIKRLVKTEVNTAFSTRFKNAAPFFYRVIAVLITVGLITTGLVVSWGERILTQRASIQATIGKLALVPEVVLNVGLATAEFRRQQGLLETKELRRWEIEDRLEEIEALRVGISRRLTRLLAAHIRQDISPDDLTHHTESVRQFGKALSLMSEVLETDDDNYKERAQPFLQEAIARDLTFTPSTVKARFAEPHLKFASLLITRFADQPSPSLLKDAKESLLVAEKILEADTDGFYAEEQYGKYLLSEVHYQHARYLFNLGRHCRVTSNQVKQECEKIRSGDVLDTGLRDLSRASWNYSSWRIGSGQAPAVNPRFTYYRGWGYHTLANGPVKLSEAEKEFRAAIAEARTRNSSHLDALNGLAWVLSAGYEEIRKASSQDPKAKYYSTLRSQAIRYAHEALALSIPETELHARLLGTLAVALQNFELHYHAASADFRAIMTVLTLERRYKARVGRASEELADLRTGVCRRLFKEVDEVLQSNTKPNLDAFRVGRLFQVRAFVREECPEFAQAPTSKKAIVEDHAHAYKSFRAAINEAREQGSESLLGEIGLALSKTWLAEGDAKQLVQLEESRKQLEKNTKEFEKTKPRRRMGELDTLARLESDHDHLRQHFVARSPTSVMRNNIAWMGIWVRGDLNSDVLVSMSADAVLEDQWRDLASLHSLAASLYRKGTADTGGGISDRPSFERGESIIHDLVERFSTDTDVQRLRHCFDEAVRKQATGQVPPIEVCLRK